MEATDALAAATALGIERAIVVGTSRGGIIAMILGTLRAGLVAGVVLIDIGPVIEGTGLLRIKGALAALSRPLRNWDDAADLLRSNAGERFSAVTDAEWHALARATFGETPAGLTPLFDRKLLRTLDDLDVTRPIPALWRVFASLARVPLLVVRGENSDVLSSRTLEEMRARHSHLEDVTVPGQGHAPLLRDAPTLMRLEAFAAHCDTAFAAEQVGGG
jgi:pimeloyl-ACP methyl ester carboxylesterase